jgi:hypothetical protein
MKPFTQSSIWKTAAILGIAVTLGLPAGGTSYAGETAEGRWVQTRDENGIRVSRKEVPGSPFLALRGEGDVDEPLLLVGSVLVDVARSREWVDSVVDARVLRSIDASECITYTHVGTPITTADRDFVAHVKVDVDPVAKRVVIRIHSVSDPKAPATHCVRGEIVESALVLTPIDGGRRTHVVAEIHADPKGSVAAWVVNFFQKDWGYNTLKRLRTQASKPDIQVSSGLKTLLQTHGYFDVEPASSGVALTARE